MTIIHTDTIAINDEPLNAQKLMPNSESLVQAPVLAIGTTVDLNVQPLANPRNFDV